MLCLGIHTAGTSCQVAIVDELNVLADIRENMRRGHDQRLPILTQNAFEQTGLAFGDVKRIAVCVGPGSFTGIRVGVAFARGLALALDQTAYGVTSLEALAGLCADGPSMPILPAKQRLPDISYWSQSFGMKDHIHPEELNLESLSDILDSGVMGITTEDALKDAQTRFPNARYWMSSDPSAVNLARYARRSAASALRPASPVYVRPPDAIPSKKHVIPRY